MAERLSATLEDYLRVVLGFQRDKQFARVSDIAGALGVAKSAVTAALRSLSSRGLLNYQPYEPVTLTSEGEQRAEEIVLRHRVISDFLRDALDVDPGRAESIACRIEHAIDRHTLERFICFLAFMSMRGAGGGTWRQEFRDFTRKGARGRTSRQCIRAYLREARREMALRRE